MKTVLVALMGWGSIGLSGDLNSLDIRFHIDIQEMYLTNAKADPETGVRSNQYISRRSERNVEGVYTKVIHDPVDPTILDLSGEPYLTGIQIKFLSVAEAHAAKTKLENLSHKKHLTILHKPV